jgi:hypothetical protein
MVQASANEGLVLPLYETVVILLVRMAARELDAVSSQNRRKWALGSCRCRVNLLNGKGNTIQNSAEGLFISCWHSSSVTVSFDRTCLQ